MNNGSLFESIWWRILHDHPNGFEKHEAELTSDTHAALTIPFVCLSVAWKRMGWIKGEILTTPNTPLFKKVRSETK